MHIQEIIAGILSRMDVKNQVRDETLRRSRELIRSCGLTTRAIHRHEMDTATELLRTVREQARAMTEPLRDHPDLYYMGYTTDALKEWVEAEILYAIITGASLPTPEDMDVPDRVYLGGLAEAATELRRHILDLLRRQELERAEYLLNWMDDIYDALILVDYPDAITGGLRRSVDILRGVLERTRGDVTLTWQHDRLARALREAERRWESGG